MPFPAVATDGDDLLIGREIEALDGYFYAQYLRREGKGQRVIQHCEEGRALLGVAVGIDQRLFNQSIEPGRRKAGLLFFPPVPLGPVSLHFLSSARMDNWGVDSTRIPGRTPVDSPDFSCSYPMARYARRRRSNIFRSNGTAGST